MMIETTKLTVLMLVCVTLSFTKGELCIINEKLPFQSFPHANFSIVLVDIQSVAVTRWFTEANAQLCSRREPFGFQLGMVLDRDKLYSIVPE